ncbi:MAG: helix-turn-helix domain-containing protein [Frankia sp.]
MAENKTAAGTPAGTSWTAEQVRALGVTTSLTTASQILGIGRAKSYALARAGTFPVPVLRVGRSYRVPVAPLLRLLYIDGSPFTEPGRAETGGLDETRTHEHQ